jgi:hypothetical protein
MADDACLIFILQFDMQMSVMNESATTAINLLTARSTIDLAHARSLTAPIGIHTDVGLNQVK